MTADSAVRAGRSLAEALMTDACTVTRVDPDAPKPVMDPVTLECPPAARVTIYSGKCRIQIASVMGEASGADAGDRRVTSQGFVLQLPVAGSEAVSKGDVAEVTSAVHDVSLVGREFTVIGRHEKSQATARRLRVEAVTG